MEVQNKNEQGSDTKRTFKASVNSYERKRKINRRESISKAGNLREIRMLRKSRRTRVVFQFRKG